MEGQRQRRDPRKSSETPASRELAWQAERWRAHLALPAKATIYWMAYFDDLLVNFCLEPEVPKERRQQAMERLTGHVVAYNAALPLHEAERRWVLSVAAHTEMDPDIGGYFPVEGAYEPLLDTEARIVSGGLRQVVRGRELVQRWVSWRRSIGQFAPQSDLDQSSYSIARAELANISSCLRQD